MATLGYIVIFLVLLPFVLQGLFLVIMFLFAMISLIIGAVGAVMGNNEKTKK